MINLLKLIKSMLLKLSSFVGEYNDKKNINNSLILQFRNF